MVQAEGALGMRIRARGALRLPDLSEMCTESNVCGPRTAAAEMQMAMPLCRPRATHSPGDACQHGYFDAPCERKTIMKITGEMRNQHHISSCVACWRCDCRSVTLESCVLPEGKVFCVFERIIEIVVDSLNYSSISIVSFTGQSSLELSVSSHL